MRTQEKLIYTNERGESIEFSPASSYHVNFKDVTGLSDVRNAIYSTNSMGQDGVDADFVLTVFAVSHAPRSTPLVVPFCLYSRSAHGIHDCCGP